MEMLRFENVVTGYGSTMVIDGFTASIEKGEFVGLIGSNGTGKSTLLNCVSGILPILQGRILVEGDNNAKLTHKERAKRIAVVPQSFNIDYDFYAEDIVMMGRNPYMSFRERESREDWDIVDEAMKMTKTDVFKGKLFNELSGGEKQRVIIARAIAQQTDIILLDEPTSALDLQHQIEVMELIERLNKDHDRTVLAVLHDLNLAARYCKRLIMMNKGKVIADGKPEEVLNQQNLHKIYDMQMIVRNNPIFERPEIIPIRVLNEKQVAERKKIHIICGGGSAAKAMETLSNKGHQVSIGVVNHGDDDWIMARYLGVDMVAAGQFTDITDDDQARNMKMVLQADILYIANTPIGNSNVRNIRGLEAFPGRIFIHEGILDNDFTKVDEVARIVEKLKATGRAVLIKDIEELEKRIATIG